VFFILVFCGFGGDLGGKLRVVIGNWVVFGFGFFIA